MVFETLHLATSCHSKFFFSDSVLCLFQPSSSGILQLRWIWQAGFQLQTLMPDAYCAQSTLPKSVFISLSLHSKARRTFGQRIAHQKQKLTPILHTSNSLSLHSLLPTHAHTHTHTHLHVYLRIYFFMVVFPHKMQAPCQDGVCFAQSSLQLSPCVDTML